jgi:hypothetical protein
MAAKGTEDKSRELLAVMRRRYMLILCLLPRRIVDHGADSFGLVSSRTLDRTPRWQEAVMIIGASVIVIPLAVVRLLR